MSTAAEIKKIKSWWPLEPTKRISRFRNGAINRSYPVYTGKKKYVLRIYSHKTAVDIKFEIKLLSALRGLPVPGLIKIGNRTITQFNSQPAVIYGYIPGRHLKKFDKKQLRQIGAFLAKFHEQGRSFRWTGRRMKYYDFPEKKIGEYEQTIKRSKVKHKERLPGIIADVRRHAPDRGLGQGPLHIDIKPENVLFDKGDLSGVIDFDNSYIGPYLLDLAKTMLWFGLKKDRFNAGISKEVLRGYSSIKKLTGPEQKELPKIIRFAFASHLFVDFYMMAKKKIPEKYFDYLMTDFYKAYKNYFY